MKPTHLEVTPEGIFVIENCPEEPKECNYHLYYERNKYHNAQLKYKEALASCKRIRVSDQDLAAGMIVLKYPDSMKYRGSYAVGIKPGIYQVFIGETDQIT